MNGDWRLSFIEKSMAPGACASRGQDNPCEPRILCRIDHS